MAVCIIIIVILIFLLIIYIKSSNYYKREAKKASSELEDIKVIMELEENRIRAERENINNLEKIVSQKTIQFPWLVNAISQYESLKIEAIESYLLHKKRPAGKAADVVKNIRHDLINYIRKSKTLEFKVEYYESLFPWLLEYIDNDESISNVCQFYDSDYDGNEDLARRWIPAAEWHSLEEDTRNQLALDRYVSSIKSPWQIGRDYEQFIGYSFELKGYKVTYYGMEEKIKDMGRDLIAIKGDEVIVIQCKCWSAHKTIHEKHIFQLYGSLICMRIQDKNKEINAVFITSTMLSDVALKVAKMLNIRVEVNKKLSDYPRIKCNISSKSGEKIYHLPFDQQYDHVRIDEDKGECYAFTIKEARKKGFRRAMKHNFIKN